jgi:hypothetical protein
MSREIETLWTALYIACKAPCMDIGSSWHGTTILTVRKGGLVAIGGDGQVSIGQTIVKANAK